MNNATPHICTADIKFANPDKFLASIAGALSQLLEPAGYSVRWLNIVNFDPASPEYNPDGSLGRFRVDPVIPIGDLPVSKEDAIKASKHIRLMGDRLAQLTEGLRKSLIASAKEEGFAENAGEAIANCVISMRSFEDGVMRQGQVLRHIGNPTPYPESKNPESTRVEPTADHRKL